MIPERERMMKDGDIVTNQSERAARPSKWGLRNCGVFFPEKMSLNPNTEVMFPSLTSASRPGGDHLLLR